MKEQIFSVKSNEKIAPSTWKMVLRGDTSEISGSGQFVDIAIDGMYLRRPISVCDRTSNTLTLVYKTVGKGTEAMSALKYAAKVNILTGLGNGFSVGQCKERALLVGGGVGIAPLVLLSKELAAAGKRQTVILGFNTADEIMLGEEFASLGADLYIATMDGSAGTKGFVTDVLKKKKIRADYFYACGPKPMLKALCECTELPGQVSMEERMGCGFGICFGCSLDTAYGPKRVCKDGPVFKKEDIVW